jgi:methionyl-tRNA formyltransferase
MSEINFSQIGEPKFALLGAGYHLCEFARLLVDQGFPKPIIVTHPKEGHERDRRLLTDPKIYQDIFNTANELDLELIESKSVNKESIFGLLLEKKCNAAFSLSCRSIIKSEFIKAFEGRVFNIHPSMLPRERGGGTFSWRIMNDQKEISATIHLIDEGVDTGAIVLQKKTELDIARPLPSDFMIKTNQLYVELLIKFLDAIKRNSPLKLQSQDENQATYLPRLHTENNAAIDWSWPVKDIEQFIRAFGTPYPGAYTYVNNDCITIEEADAESSDIVYHPYASGRIVSHLRDGSIRVIAKGGFLVIHRVSMNGQSSVPGNLLKETDMLSTPSKVLFNAKTSVVPVSKMNVPDKNSS